MRKKTFFPHSRTLTGVDKNESSFEFSVISIDSIVCDKVIPVCSRVRLQLVC